MDSADGEWEACLRRVRAGDSAAARELAERVFPLVAKIVRAYVPRGTSDEDWIQESLLRIFHSLNQFRGSVPFEHWVAKVSVNVCRDLLRRAKRRPETRWADLSENEMEALQNSAKLASTSPTPAQQVAARELTEKILECLTPDDRLIIKMLDIEERSVAEIAELFGWSKTLVKIRAFRARRRLRGVVAKLLGEKPHEQGG
jgi:RNA polymerase sigma-70 factor (ECF subfamily)